MDALAPITSVLITKLSLLSRLVHNYYDKVGTITMYVCEWIMVSLFSHVYINRFTVLIKPGARQPQAGARLVS